MLWTSAAMDRAARSPWGTDATLSELVYAFTDRNLEGGMATRLLHIG